jgi:mRNA interferase MazF
MELKQYQVVLVNLDPKIGSETKKTRPCVIISPDEMNQYLQTIIVAPITSNSKPYPSRVTIQSKQGKGYLVLDQIRTIDRNRIVKIFNSLSQKEITQTKQVIQEMLVD